MAVHTSSTLDRGPDMVYDDVLGITWTRNANLAGTGFMAWPLLDVGAPGNRRQSRRERLTTSFTNRVRMPPFSR